MAILLTHAPYPSAPPATVPAAVGPLIIEAADAALTVRWTAPPSGGTPIGAYRVLLRDTSQNGNLFHPVGTTDGRTHYLNIANLLNNAAYQLAVFAINAVGGGPWSAVATGVPQWTAAPGTIDSTSGLLHYFIDYTQDNQFSTWNRYGGVAFLASDQHGWVKFGYTGSRLRLDLPTADNGCADVEVVVNGTVVASISEVGNVGATKRVDITVPEGTGNNAILLRRGQSTGYLGYFATNLFTALDGSFYYLA